jgi:4-aminobutyrate aminotransferase-like enzyme
MFDNSTMPASSAPAAVTPPERQTVLHSWCVQTQWDAPTIIGGAGARLFSLDGRSILDMSSLAECSNLGHQVQRGVSFAARGNLILLAPPLVIAERELAEALDLLDRLIGELTVALASAPHSGAHS